MLVGWATRRRNDDGLVFCQISVPLACGAKRIRMRSGTCKRCTGTGTGSLMGGAVDQVGLRHGGTFPVSVEDSVVRSVDG